MKKPVVIFLHLGYWLLYGLLMLLIYALVALAPQDDHGLPAGTGTGYKQENGLTTVREIGAGGPSAKQGTLKVGDILLKVAQGDHEPVDVTYMDLDNIRGLLRGKRGTEVRITVKKPDGSIVVIPIIRDIYKNDKGPTIGMWFWLLFGLGVVPGLFGFYFFYTFLFSRFLSRRRVPGFILAALLASVLASLPGELLLYIVFSGNKWGINWRVDVFFDMSIIMSFNALLNGILGLVMRGFISWYGDIKVKEDLSKKNYETELALIKSQINPHFLFNTLNNIDVLILKDPAKASEYLNKLSGMMRFMLYETKTDKIPLSKELEHIERYIELQKIRSSNPDFIKYTVKGSPAGISLEPMLFIPFLENAFKHSENKKIENAIQVSFVIEKDKITFECSNLYPENAQTRPDYGGLGNELISKRLALLYPGRHTLKITDQNHVYTVNIELITA